MNKVIVFILDFNDFDINEIRHWLQPHKDLIGLSDSQTFSKFIRYFVFEKFFNIKEPSFISQNGKPCLVNSSLCFNISHTNKKVVMAIADYDIGIDIEYLDRQASILKISKRYFKETEYKSISESSSPIKDFYGLWTLKEAEVKRSSLGIAKGLSQASFDKNDRGEWVSKSKPDDFTTFFYDKFVISICCKNIHLKPLELFKIVDFNFEKITMKRMMYGTL